LGFDDDVNLTLFS